MKGRGGGGAGRGTSKHAPNHPSSPIFFQVRDTEVENYSKRKCNLQNYKGNLQDCLNKPIYLHADIRLSVE